MRLIDADSIDIRKWFVVPADIQRIQAMLDETDTVSGITLRELLESTDGTTDCEVWLSDRMMKRYFSVITGTADALLHRTDIPILGCKAGYIDAANNTLVVQLEDE